MQQDVLKQYLEAKKVAKQGMLPYENRPDMDKLYEDIKKFQSEHAHKNLYWHEKKQYTKLCRKAEQYIYCKVLTLKRHIPTITCKDQKLSSSLKERIKKFLTDCSFLSMQPLENLRKTVLFLEDLIEILKDLIEIKNVLTIIKQRIDDYNDTQITKEIDLKKAYQTYNYITKEIDLKQAYDYMLTNIGVLDKDNKNISNIPDKYLYTIYK